MGMVIPAALDFMGGYRHPVQLQGEAEALASSIEEQGEDMPEAVEALFNHWGEDNDAKVVE